MERERITISIKKDILASVDNTIDGTNVRNRSHAIETLINRSINNKLITEAVIMLGGKDALKLVPSAIENILSLKNLGIEKIYIATGFLSNKIKQKIGNGNDYGIEIEYIEGEGSGGALLGIKNKIKNTFLVIEPEVNIKSLDNLLSVHKKFNACGTIFTSNLTTFAGVHIYETKIFEYIPKEFSMLNEDIVPKLSRLGEIILVSAE